MAARTPERDELLARHAAACDYNTCAVDDAVVEEHLRAYLQALGVDRHVARLRVGWDLSEHPSLSRYVARVLDDFKKRNPQERERARSRRVARDARDAQAAPGALDAQDAPDARAAQDARDARVALVALDALVARDARDARVALV